MVVIGILALLLAITVPALTGILGTSTAKQTRATMETLRTAIETYAEDRPMQDQGTVLRDVDPTADETYQRYRNLFGPYPPAPTAAFAHDGAVLDDFLVTEEDDPRTIAKFIRLIKVAMGPFWWKQPPAMTPTNSDYATSECLVLFLQSASPEAALIIDGLPEQVRANKDRDFAFDDQQAPYEQWQQGAETSRDLPEVLDGWGQPIRYGIKPTRSGAYMWELRSAGLDQKFADMFTPSSVSDDVVLTNQ
jgi:type II secretory pathway pseudopilin PulG